MSELIVLYGAWGVFIVAFAAATILPFSSEVLVVAYIAAGGDPWITLIAASAGNTLGGMTSYLLGYFLEIKRVIKFLSINPKRLEKIYPYAHRWGYMTGFLGFVPVIGDVVMVALGSLRSNAWGTFITSAIGKTVRYYAIIFLQMQIFN